LEYKGYEVFLPIYQSVRLHGAQRVSGPAKALFPGYIFSRVGAAPNGLVVTTPGVLRIVGRGRQHESVEDFEIEALKILVRSGLQARPWPVLEEGAAVEVTCGPLRGCRGVFRRYKDRVQLFISITILQRSVTVLVSEEWIVPLERSLPSRGDHCDGRLALVT
jgi:transcription antitermination factor NusG